MADALAPTGEVVAALSLMGGWKPITAYSLRRHSGSGLSGKPPSEPFSFLKRATRFIISARVQVRIIFQASMGVIMNERHEAPPPALPARRRRGRAGAGAGGGRRGAAGATRAPDDAERGDRPHALGDERGRRRDPGPLHHPAGARGLEDPRAGRPARVLRRGAARGARPVRLAERAPRARHRNAGLRY